MKKLPIIMLSAAMLATSVAPSFAAANYANLQAGAPVVQVDDHHWRHHDHGRHGGYYRSDWRDDRDWHHHHHHHNNAGAIIGGLAAGAIIGGALAPERRDYYYYDDY